MVRPVDFMYMLSHRESSIRDQSPAGDDEKLGVDFSVLKDSLRTKWDELAARGKDLPMVINRTGMHRMPSRLLDLCLV